MGSKSPFSLSDETKKPKKNTVKSGGEEVLLNLPAGLKYKMPGKRQRVLIGSIVVGLNLVFVLGVIIYFYSPSFQQFVYNLGR
tara:strand:- start:821 stop:1069 length:249 start_codon:yes stop_codon:yes gene_type:complete